MSQNNLIHQVDVIIFGGGVAGLWTLHQLKQAGYKCLLLETQALGQGQTINAQGIIHSGIKYMLTGQQSQATQAIASMMHTWDQCLAGQGIIDLSKVNCLSDVHYLWSEKPLNKLFNNFLSSQLLHSACHSVAPQHYPEVFRSHFQGSMIAVQEKVLSTASLLTELASSHWSSIYKIDRFDLHMDSNYHIANVQIYHEGQTMQFAAQRYVFTVGGGYLALEKYFPNLTTVQVRPLHMVVAYHSRPMPLYGHWIRMHPTPWLTITTHPCQDGRWAWYLGGHLAEQGIHRSPAKQQQQAKQLLNRLMPWIDCQSLSWHSFLINRYEGKQSLLARPHTPTLKATGNVIMAWPTKLTFAPRLSATITQTLQKEIVPYKHATLPTNIWPRPTIARAQWDL